jgi:hypothetical protein
MSARFAEAARRLAGRAGLLLGWTPDGFWHATPEDLATALAALQPQHEATMDSGAFARLREMFPDG